MAKNDYYVEPPRLNGAEVECFIQETKPECIATHAHIHNSCEILYIKEGLFHVLVDGNDYDLKKGDLILFCSNSIHHIVAKDSPINEYYVFKMPPSLLLDFMGQESEYIIRFAFNRDGQRIFWRGEDLAGSEIADALKSITDEYHNPRYAASVALRLKIAQLFLAILRADEPIYDKANSKTVELIYNVLQFALDNYASDIDEKELAKQFGMSYSYFTRSFKEITGMPFRKHLNLTRVRKAEQMILSTNKSITDIATECGYNSTSYFINTFRTLTGKTPYQLRLQTEKRPL